MAEIKAATNEKVFQIAAFGGLNQAPDGDTKLKYGEAAEMNNFRITRDGNLQRRPGTKTILDISQTAQSDLEVIDSSGETAGYFLYGAGGLGDLKIKDGVGDLWNAPNGSGTADDIGIDGVEFEEWHISHEPSEPGREVDRHPVKGLWVGYVNGRQYMLGASGGKLFRLWSESGGFSAQPLGKISTDKDVHIFGFSNIAYILDGSHYWQWDGETFAQVSGYIPLVMQSIPPEGSTAESITFENVNRLTAKRRVWLSPDGSGTVFHLPESGIASIDSVEKLYSSGTDIPYIADAGAGTITFTSAPPQRVNGYEVIYTVENDYRSDVENMQYAELFAGTQDTRIFLYGDGTNKTIYSGIDYNGRPRADYFPDLYEALVGDENTPITAMIRHYSSLACFKSDSAWSISASSTTLSDGLNIPTFYVTPVNKTIGNEAPGQVSLILNSPYTLFGNDLYEWKNSSYYTSNLTRDERQARRISDRIWATLNSFKTKDCVCYDDNAAQEYYICFNGTALVYNYAVDAWSRYTEFPVSSLANIGDDLYIGTPDGKLKHFSTSYLNDDGEAINAYWESGSMSFGQEYMRKYSAMTFIGVKPESSTDITVSVETDKKVCEEKRIKTSSAQFDFNAVDFADMTWDIKRNATIYREKIKAKKFVFYKLLLYGESADARCTILSADIRVRFTGFTK